jgi:hypothetical protein
MLLQIYVQLSLVVPIQVFRIRYCRRAIIIVCAMLILNAGVLQTG